ncbi:MAG: VWA domain-containing protein [Chitinivibrionales bacterium]|nr:VWA domain-containing protein [Chitinivibrionales bacterium]
MATMIHGSGYSSLCFSAFVAMEQVKIALRIAGTNEHIRSLLITGPTGTAKSAIASSIGDVLRGRPVCRISPGTTEDRVMGHIDIGKTISTGRPVYESGVLARAHGGFVIVDNADLISRGVIGTVLRAAQEQLLIVEREGCSMVIPTRTTVIATAANEQDLSPSLIQSFDIMVRTSTIVGIADRCDVIERNCGSLSYEPPDFTHESEVLERASDRLSKVRFSSWQMRNLCKAVETLSPQGNRCEIVAAHVARTLAALDGRDEISEEDIKTALELAVGHCLNPQIQYPEDSPPAADSRENDCHEPDQAQQETGGQSNKDHVRPCTSATDSGPGASDTAEYPPPEDSGAIGDTIRIPSFLPRLIDRKVRPGGPGRRTRTRTSRRNGRYVRYRIPSGRPRDIAVDATLRAAAPFQRLRPTTADRPLIVLPSDFREKVRETRTGSTILLLVDTSTSMGLNRRIERARGACLSLLKQAYSKRDTVGLITFHDRYVTTILPPTRSVERAHRLLPLITTGGKTPLAQAIEAVVTYASGLRSRDRDCIPVVALFSDFRPTQSQGGGDPAEEVFRIAYRASYEKLRFLIVDSECGFVRLGYGKKLCDILDGTYIHTNDEDNESVASGIRQILRGAPR